VDDVIFSHVAPCGARRWLYQHGRRANKFPTYSPEAPDCLTLSSYTLATNSAPGAKSAIYNCIVRCEFVFALKTSIRNAKNVKKPRQRLSRNENEFLRLDRRHRVTKLANRRRLHRFIALRRNYSGLVGHISRGWQGDSLRLLSVLLIWRILLSTKQICCRGHC